MIELINKYHNDLLAAYLRIKKTWKMVTLKYYWLFLQYNIETYVKGYDVCLALKAVKYKSYSNFQLLLVPTCW